ncbi:MAG: hypothetical protein V3S68_03645 [Dehalococcoidia bacterium]
MTKPKEDARPKGSAYGEPNDARRPPKRITVSCDIAGKERFKVVVIGVHNTQNQKVQIDLIQVMDPGFNMPFRRDWDRLRDAIVDGAESQGYHAWGMTRSMVDIHP